MWPPRPRRSRLLIMVLLGGQTCLLHGQYNAVALTSPISLVRTLHLTMEFITKAFLLFMLVEDSQCLNCFVCSELPHANSVKCPTSSDSITAFKETEKYVSVDKEDFTCAIGFDKSKIVYFQVSEYSLPPPIT